MTPRKKWPMPAIAFVGLALVASLVVRPGCTSRRAGEAGQEPVTTLTGHRFPIQALAFGPDGATVTSVGYFLDALEGGAEVAVWDVGTGAPAAKRTEHLSFSPFLTLAIAPGGRRLVATQNQSLWLWDAAQPDKRRLCDHPSPILALAFSGDGEQLAVADRTHDVTLLDATTGRPRACCKGHVRSVSALAFAPDGRALASGGQDHAIRLWDTATGEARGVLRGHDNIILTLAFSRDGRTLASGDMDGVVMLWNLPSLTERATLETSGYEVAAMAFSSDSRTLARTTGRTVELWDVATRKLVASLEGHGGRVRCLAYSPDGTFLASGGSDRAVRIWRVRW